MEILNKQNPNKIQKYQRNIESYLNKTKVGTGSNIKYTHVSMGDFAGKFMLDKKQIKEFNKLYAEAIEYGVIFNIAEKPKDYGPLLIDIDLELPIEDYNEKERLYNDDMIYEIINTYREVILEYLDLNSNELLASIFEKDNPTMKLSTVKDGFHVIFHALIVHYKLRHIIRSKVVKKLENNSLFSKFIKPINDIIDKAVVNTNCWLLPGSKKKDGYLYRLKTIVDDSNNYIDITETINNKYKLIKLYSLQNKIYCEANASTFNENITSELIDEEFSKINEKRYNINNNTFNIEISKNKEDEVRKAKILVSMLSDERNNTYDDWIKLGWSLHNIDNSLLETWIEFSRKSSKFKEGDCESRWFQMRNDGLTIRSLMYWAEEDNYQKYHEFIKQEFAEILNKSLDGSTYYIAKALYSKYIERFVCSSIKNNLWYEFKNHRWVEVPDGYTLKKELSESFVNEYSLLVSKYSKKSINLEGSDKQEIQKKITIIQNIVNKLMDISFKERIMKEATILFFDPEFEKKLDENYELIGFNNGIYDLLNEEFREGRPDDFITKNTGVDYYQFNKSNPYYSKMFKFFEEILPNESVRTYMLMSLATCVAGHNKEEKCRIVTGSGSNGKSLLFSLVQLSLGNYYVSCPITIITRKRNSSNSASPELLRIKGARCGCFQETDDDEKLNIGILKEITGNDSFMVRGLFKDPIEIKPQIKFFIACNKKPRVESADGGIWRRLREVEFNSKFVENPVKINEYLIDNTLKEKVKDWAPLFASYLIHLYVTEYKKLSVLTEPDEVKMSTDKYKSENDPFTEFYITKIIHTKNKKDSINNVTIYNDFKIWYKGSREVSRLPPQLEFTKFMVEKLGEPKFNKWKGYKYNSNEEVEKSDDDDDDEIIKDE
jgi:P4 family phage/plasmid primase-like protien